MRERFPRLFDGLIWPAVILGDAVLLLNLPASSFLALQRLGADHRHLALIAAGGALAYTALCPIAARFGPRLGRRRLFLLGMAMYATWGLLLAMADSIAQLVLCHVYVGAAGALLWPNLEAELSRGREGPLLRKRLSIFNTMWCAGTIVGPFVGAWLYPREAVALGAAGREAINVAFHASVVLGVGAVALLALWRVRIPGAAELAAPSLYEAPRDPVRLKAFQLMSYVGNFMCYVVLGVLRNLYEMLANQQWSGREPAAKCFWLLVTLASSGTVMFALLFFLHRWSYRLKRHLGAQAAVAGALLVIALSGDLVWVAAGFLVVGMATSFIYSGSLFYSIEGTTESNHMAGWHESVLGAGSAFGLLLSGHMPLVLRWLGVGGDYWVMRSPYLLAAGLFAAGIIVQVAIYARHAPRFSPSLAARRA